MTLHGVRGFKSHLHRPGAKPVRKALATLVVGALVASGCSRITGGPFADACEADVAYNEAFVKFFVSLSEPLGEEPPNEQMVADMQASFDRLVEKPLADLESNAPGEIEDEIDKAAKLTRQFRESADRSIFETDEAARLSETIRGFFFEKCKDNTAKVTAVDFAYQGAPKSLEAGAIRLRLSNTGNETHELAVFTKNKGVTESFDDILEAQAIDKVTLVGRTSAEPDKSGYLTARLRAGDYLFACFVPRGTAGDTEGTGVPHYVLGMKQEVKVI